MSSTEAGFEKSLYFKVVKITLYSLILLLCLIGNSMVVFIVCRTKRMRMPSNLLILNLAICDLITPIASIPFDLALEENDYIWPFGGALCKTLWPLATLSTISASLTLALISFDRYRVIMHPFKQRLSSKQVKSCIAFTHLLGLLFVLPYVYYLDLSAQSHKCEETWPAFSYRQAYTLFLFIAQYGIPLAFMSIVYSITLLNLHGSSSKFENPTRDFSRPSKISLQADAPVTNGNTNGSRLDVTRDCRKLSRDTLGQRHDLVGRDQNIRATKMFATVVTVFATCRLPNEIFWLWSDFGDGHASENSNIAGIICRMFTYTNSIFNPVIYWTFSKDFKKGFKEIFFSLCKRNRNGIWDDESDQDEKRYQKLSTLSDSISFVWRKISRSRSETSYHPALRENQPSPVNTSHVRQESPSKRPCNGNMSTYGDTPETSRKKSSLKTTQFDDSKSQSLFLLPAQSKLAKLSEESLCEAGEEVVGVRTRRYGTVQPPGKHAVEASNTIIKITRPLSEIDRSFSRSKDYDTAIHLTLFEGEDCQSTSEGIILPAESKNTLDDTKESVENINVHPTQSAERNKKDCDNAIISATSDEVDNSQSTSEEIFSSEKRKDAFKDKEKCIENTENICVSQSVEHNEKDREEAISSTSEITENCQIQRASEEVIFSEGSKTDGLDDKTEYIENMENSEACKTQLAEHNENEKMFIKQPTSDLNRTGIKETNC